jgi:hypothetical protein
MKSTELQTLIDWDTIMPMRRSSGGHDDQMKALFKGATVLAHWNEEDYQGTVATAVRLEDGRFCWYQDSYGSCAGCDSWEDANDDDVRKLCINLAIDAEIFLSLDEMIADMESTDCATWRANAGKELAAIIKASDAYKRKDIMSGILLSCPFCGAAVEIKGSDIIHPPNDTCLLIIMHCWDINKPRDEILARLVKAWNTRAATNTNERETP